MKQSYCRSGVFHIFRTLGIFLTSFTLLSSCSNELEDFSSDLKEGTETPTSTKDDSVLRFKTIDELENISIKDIPGDNDGFELKELSYECVDTIELRALRFDVKAKLASSSNQERVISFAAEVGPELVSVEYYPGGEMVPAHDNMMTAYYPKVERYRNYSDGSRIGPDEFYDYGHFIEFEIDIVEQDGDPSVIKFDYKTPVWTGTVINPERIFYKDGVFYCYNKIFIEYNLNTTEIGENGACFSGEDFFYINKYIRSEFEPGYEGWLREDSKEIMGNYYSSRYIPSRIYGHEENEEMMDIIEIMNLCSNVPDISPISYPEDKKSLSNGWYFGDAHDFRGYDYFLYSKRDLNLICDWYEYGITKGQPISWYMVIHTQYLVIDGRIINFDKLAFGEYPGILNLTPQFSFVKTSDGYVLKAQTETKLYGEKFEAILDVEMKGVNGPEQTFDYTSYDAIESQDQNELEQLNAINYGTRGGSSAQPILRPYGKSISVDHNLPNSLRSINKTRTITTQEK